MTPSQFFVLYLTFVLLGLAALTILAVRSRQTHRRPVVTAAHAKEAQESINDITAALKLHAAETIIQSAHAELTRLGVADPGGKTCDEPDCENTLVHRIRELTQRQIPTHPLVLDPDTFEHLALMGRTQDGRIVLGNGAAERLLQHSRFFRQADPPWQGCTLPPTGMYCSRQKGHEGPCPTRPAPLDPLTLEQVAQQLERRGREWRTVTPGLNGRAQEIRRIADRQRGLGAKGDEAVAAHLREILAVEVESVGGAVRMLEKELTTL